jgi:dynein heavy chain
LEGIEAEKFRHKALIDCFTLLLYENICRSLFEKDKLLFSMLMCINILLGENKVNPTFWRYFLSGYGGEVKIPENPTTYFDVNEWPAVYREFYGM